MTNDRDDVKTPADEGRQPIFLVPGVVTALVGLMAAVHLAATMALNQEGQNLLVEWLAFIPYRLVDSALLGGGLLPLVWTPFTHALLHANWEHLLVNVAWLAIFATPVARRYGTWPTLVIFFVSAAAGALAFLATTLPNLQILVGASGGVAGLTGAAVRFMFQPIITGVDPETGERVVLGRKIASFRELMSDSRSRAFVLIWVLLNAAVPLFPLLTGAQVEIAWQAHLGGFFAGILMVGLFERRGH